MPAFEDITILDRLITDAAHVCIVTHIRPDGDAVGSALGMFLYLRELRGKNATVLLPSGPPRATDFLMEGIDSGAVLRFDTQREEVEQVLFRCNLLVFTDMGLCSRAGEGFSELLSSLPASLPKVLVDHHPGPDRGLFQAFFSKTDISSASELLFWVLKALQGPDSLPADVLTPILTGITTDTNNFGNSVFPSTLRACSEILEAGVDRDCILRHLYQEYKEGRVRLMGRLLSSDLRITKDGFAYIILTEETYDSYGMESGDLEGLVNVPLSINGVRMSIYLREDRGIWHVSLRSKPGTSAREFAMRHFNGGGHEQASGGSLKAADGVMTKEDAENYILKAIRDFSSPSTQMQ